MIFITLRKKTIPIKTKRERGMLIRGRMIRAEKKRKTMSEMPKNKQKMKKGMERGLNASRRGERRILKRDKKYAIKNMPLLIFSGFD